MVTNNGDESTQSDVAQATSSPTTELVEPTVTEHIETNGKALPDLETARKQLSRAGDKPLFALADRLAAGKALRQAVPRASHAGWQPPANRRDPIEILQEQNKTRIQVLVPVRFGRMLQSPFTFLRGSAAVMAADLARTPVSGIRVQACGDCHLSNFGGFATPERNVVFDINDFDETLPAPWEWDLKRLAASFVVAGRNNGLSDAQCRAATRSMVGKYRTQMAEFAEMHALDVWYAKLDLETIAAQIKDPEVMKTIRARVEKEKARNVPEYRFPRMTEVKEGPTGQSKPAIKDSPPLIFHSSEIFDEQVVHDSLNRYREALPEYQHTLLDRYRYYDVAAKVVGVGSVGMLCAVALFMASDNDPLFLQIKESTRSVLEPYTEKSRYENQGQRVVMGQRLMQSASDIFLGWMTSSGAEARHFYVRQLRDLKMSPLVESFDARRLSGYGIMTGWTLARAHARSGDPAMISGYIGKNDIFDEAIEKFAVAYADQTERDHAAFTNAVRSGRIEVIIE